MLTNFLADIFESGARRYVGKHRAPRHMRYVATVQVQPAVPAAQPSSNSTG